MVQNADAGKHSRITLDGVQHVGVVSTVEAHLDEHDSSYAGCPRDRQQLFRGEAIGLVAGAGIFRIVGKADDVGRPYMDVRIDVVLRFLLAGSARQGQVGQKISSRESVHSPTILQYNRQRYSVPAETQLPYNKTRD